MHEILLQVNVFKLKKRKQDFFTIKNVVYLTEHMNIVILNVHEHLFECK